MSVDLDFLLEPLEAHASCHQQADGQRRDGHHHGIGEEIEEIQERHSDDGDERQRAVAQAGECSERQHDHCHDCSALEAAPLEFIGDGGHRALRESDGAGQRRKEHQREEQDSDQASEAHAREDLGHCYEHEGRPCV